MVSHLAVTLERGFPVESLPDLWEWLNSPRWPNFDDFSTNDYDSFYANAIVRQMSELMWAIRYEGIMCGYVSFVPFSTVTGSFHGLVIHPELRGRGIGRAALEQCIQQLLGHGFSKLMVSPFSDNLKIIRIFEELGFVREAWFKGITRRDGKSLDTIVLSLNKGD